MPVLSSERRNSPRSSLRHRPIETDQPAPDPTVLRQRRPPAGAPATTKLITPDEVEPEPQKDKNDGEVLVPRSHKRRLHPLVSVGAGLMLAVLLWAGLGQAITWGNNELNTLRYGYPRSYQTDAFVGQGDSAQHPSHFVALNLHGVVTILDFAGGDPSRVLVVASIQAPGADADLAVVTIHFLDITHDGLPDMLVTIDGLQSVLINNGKIFRPPTPDEQQQFIQYMQHQQKTEN